MIVTKKETYYDKNGNVVSTFIKNIEVKYKPRGFVTPLCCGHIRTEFWENKSLINSDIIEVTKERYDELVKENIGGVA